MFEDYKNKIGVIGSNIRTANRKSSIQIMEYGFNDSQSYRQVFIDDEPYDARVISDSKTTVRGGNGNYVIQFRDNFNPPAGTYVDIPDINGDLFTWLILYESDSILFPKHIIKKCNYYLKWKNRKDEIVERWAVFNDNTKIMDGDRKYNNNKITLPYYSTSLILPCDYETINLLPEQRFLIDHENKEGYPDAWIINNKNVISKRFTGYEGVVEISIEKHQFNFDTDNADLMVADYYKYYDPVKEIDTEATYDCRIVYNNSPELKMGMPDKVYTAEIYTNGIKVNDPKITWEVIIPEDNKEHFTYDIDNNKLNIKCVFDGALNGSFIRLVAKNDELQCSAELPVKVVSTI